MSDHFDRLLARHAPVVRAAPAPPQSRGGEGGEDPGTARGVGQGAGQGVPRRVRVRPRLAGPFERVEALRDRQSPDDGLSPAPHAAPAAGPFRTDEGPVPRGEREIRTERHTVVRETPVLSAEPAAPQGRRQPPQAVPPGPAPRPLRSVESAQAPRAAGSGRRDTGTAVPGERARGAAPLLTGRDGEPAGRAVSVRPGSGDDAAGRSARQQAAAARRGAQRAAERVVHVQIGRLEVSAATPPGAGGGGPGGPGRTGSGRTAPTVGLDDYLARGRNGERSN